jgi:cysteine desulfurase
MRAPIDPAVAAATRPFLDEAFGNPSSGHWASAPAKAALEHAWVAGRPKRK